MYKMLMLRGACDASKHVHVTINLLSNNCIGKDCFWSQVVSCFWKRRWMPWEAVALNISTALTLFCVSWKYFTRQSQLETGHTIYLPSSFRLEDISWSGRRGSSSSGSYQWCSHFSLHTGSCAGLDREKEREGLAWAGCIMTTITTYWLHCKPDKPVASWWCLQLHFLKSVIRTLSIIHNCLKSYFSLTIKYCQHGPHLNCGLCCPTGKL